MATFASRGKASCAPSRFLPQEPVRKDRLLSGFQAGPEKGGAFMRRLLRVLEAVAIYALKRLIDMLFDTNK